MWNTGVHKNLNWKCTQQETEAKEAKAKKEAPVVPAPLRDVAPAAKVGQAAPVAGPPGACSTPCVSAHTHTCS